VPDGAPPHLAVDLDRLRAVDRSATVLIAAPDDVDEGLLERLADARRRGGTVLAVGVQAAGSSAADLADVAADLALVTAEHFEVAQHVIPGAAVSGLTRRASTRGRASNRWHPLRFAR
jgi:hypothetical protein